MTEALREARIALDEGEIPIGAVVVCKGRIIGKGHNMTEKLHDPTAHAEMIAITAATEAMGGKYLSDCTLYVTLEPCQMCAGAIVQSRIKRLVVGTKSLKSGSCGSIIDILNNNEFNHKVEMECIESKDCENLIKDFLDEGSDSIFTGIVKMSRGISEMLSEMAGGIADFANLRIPTKWGSDGKPTKWMTIADKDFENGYAILKKGKKVFHKLVK